MAQLTLFDAPARKAYPEAPGHKAAGTSAEAAQAVAEDAETLRADVLATLRQRALTADEIASHLGRSILSVRPRVSELRKMGKIRATGQRRPNASGHSATVWEAVR